MPDQIEMIFEIGFNYCCRNFFSSSASVENLNLKLSANLLNEVTRITENCLVELSGDWARVLSFVEPGMDMKILATPASGGSWNECVMVRNLTCPDPVDSRFLLEQVSVVETHADKPNRFIAFGRDRRILECKVKGEGGKLVQFPHHWMLAKRSMVDRTPGVFRALTTLTPDVAVVNVLVAFVANSAPGPYKFEHPTSMYVRTHVHVCDLSFRNLKLASIRTANDDSRDVPAFHLHLEIDKNVPTSALPWLTVGDVLAVETVKPIFAQKQAWNLLHKQKGFGETKVKIYPIDDRRKVIDIEGNPVSVLPDPRVQELRSWMKERLKRDSLVGTNQTGKLSGRQLWMNGRDAVVQVERINRHTNSIFVTDFSVTDEVEVRVRSTQSNFAASLNYLFTHLEAGSGTQYLLLRNARVNTSDNTLLCSLEHVTNVPDFCFDVQELQRRKASQGSPEEEAAVSQSVEDLLPESHMQSGPSQWLKADPVPVGEGSGCVDASSQVTFEFVEDDSDTASENVDQSVVDTQRSETTSQLIPQRLKFDQSQRESKKPRVTRE